MNRMPNPKDELSGGCLCGAVQFAIKAPFRPVIQCHCGQCARWTGHYVAATQVATEQFKLINGSDHLAWYRSSNRAERGFCSKCGSSMFWRRPDDGRISILAGTLERPTGLKTSHHIFVAVKSDYYDVRDTTPCYDRWMEKTDTAKGEAD
ncbi:MAG: GFA family protein [Hyphomicrobiaceae bacterium]